MSDGGEMPSAARQRGRSPQIVGYGPGGKPRVRVPGDYVWNAPYRNLDLPGQAGIVLPLTSGKDEARHRDRALRAARDVDRNNEIIRGGLDRKANTVIGAQLRVNPMPNWRRLGQDVRWAMEFSQDAADLFADWANDERCLCDTEGHYQFGGLMWQAFRTLVGPDAEVGGVIHYESERREEYQTRWATHVQLIDPDTISSPTGKVDGKLKPADRPVPHAVTLYRGRVLDKHGRMIGFYVRRTHPSDGSADPKDAEHEFVERETYWGRPLGFHWFTKRRAGMQRAMTSLVTSLRHIKMLDRFDDATLQNAVVNGILATFIHTDMKPEEAAAHLAPANEDEDGNPYSDFDVAVGHYEKMDLRVGDQRIPVLPPNAKIEMARMADAIPNADDFRNGFLRAFASALGVSFEQLSLDFSRANYSSIRASLLEAWRQVMVERTMFTNHIAKLIYSAVIEEAFALGLLTVPAGAPDFYEERAAYTACTWTGPGMGWVDPLKEANAANTRRSGLVSTLEQEAGAQGGNWRDNMDQQALEREYADDLGIPYDVPGTGPDAAADEDPDEADGAENRQQQEN